MLMQNIAFQGDIKKCYFGTNMFRPDASLLCESYFIDQTVTM